MILHRTVFQAKFGKADDVVAHFKAMVSTLTEEQMAMLQPRILTDISGSFDTVVIETTHENLASYEHFRNLMLERNAQEGANNNMLELVESGRNEYYTIET